MLGTATATQVLVVKETRTVVKNPPSGSQGAGETVAAEAAKKRRARRRGPPGPQGPAGPAGTNASLNGVAAGGDLTGSSFPNLVLAPGAVTPGKIGTIPAVNAFQATPVNFPTGNPSTVAGLNSERIDTANMHSSTSRLTAPISGIYQVSGHVNWAANNVGERIVDLYKGGSQVYSMTADDNNENLVMVQPFAGLIRLNAGEYVEFFLFQDSGGNLMARADEFSMHWVGP